MTFEVGQRVRVLPGARSVTEPASDDYYSLVSPSKSGLIAGGPDFDGDYDVEDDDGNYWAFAPEFLSAVDKEGK